MRNVRAVAQRSVPQPKFTLVDVIPIHVSLHICRVCCLELGQMNLPTHLSINTAGGRMDRDTIKSTTTTAAVTKSGVAQRTSLHSPDGLSSLPPELQVLVALYVGYPSILQLTQTCRRVQNICDCLFVWQRLWRSAFDEEPTVDVVLDEPSPDPAFRLTGPGVWLSLSGA